MFPTLPAELRLKIWGFAMNEPRLIEIEYGPNRDNEDGSGLSMGNHQWTRVCPRSTRPPTVLQVCQEGREEGQKYYHQRTFETKADNSKERYIYYNPDADIIYFGDNTCISTIIRLPCQAKSDGIPRVAINNTGKILMCCDWDDSDSGTVMGYGFDGGISPLQALHGIDKDVAEGNDWAWPGYAGLKEVYFVVKSNLWPLEAGQIDASVCFRPARTDGITKGQIKFKEKILEALKDVNQTGGPERVGEKKWIGKDKPKFSFVSLSPPSVDEKIHDAIAVNSKDVRKLNARGWAFMKELEKSTGCIAQVPDQNYPGEPFREIGFFGTKQGVEKARALVEEKLVSLSSIAALKAAKLTSTRPLASPEMAEIPSPGDARQRCSLGDTLTSSIISQVGGV